MFPKFTGAEVLRQSEHMKSFLNIIQSNGNDNFRENVEILPQIYTLIQPIIFLLFIRQNKKAYLENILSKKKDFFNLHLGIINN